MAFDVLPGDSASPVILHVPHSSRQIVESGLFPEIVDEELDHLTDAHTDLIALGAADLAARRPWIFVNRLSRLVVDPERFLEDEMLAVGMGPIYTHGHAGRRLRADDTSRDAMLLETVFQPYAEAMTTLVGRRLAATGRALVLDVHSYPTARLPYELHGDGPRPPVCLGTDPFHTPESLVAAARAAFGDTGLDSPFAGCYVPLQYHRREAAVQALMIEIRRDQYMTEPGGPPTGGLDRITRALAALVDTVDPVPPTGRPAITPISWQG
ncbi:N-formylglutamate amidohydrolase [Actinoplanes sichuanensis]|uniref:N-formylglutamate amidohydrolase n=1 Tax=Actinoplanes sichuanensis TaxID=512349 RepID=A0ABW4AP38_9ACTN|nr:N-formylglutamate amidohydrolase [Actinoplanes sichuanensis]BEL07731.1 N-formylglutamate amidohydrolase [Actinoplanes sichuanensis]